MTLTTLATLLLVCLAIVFIWQHIAIANIAERLARQRCLQEGVQLLDQTVVMRSYRLTKSTESLFALERKFQFEFSSIGDIRYQGEITFKGKRLNNIRLQPYKSKEESSHTQR